MKSVFDLDIATRITAATTQEELLAALTCAANSIGAPYLAAMVFFDTLHGPASRAIHAMPEGYWEASADGPSYTLDPVMQHCRTSSEPLFWDRSTYRDVGADDHWLSIHRAGLAYGVCVALHLGLGRHFVLGFDWPADRAEEPLPDEDFRRRACYFTQVCATCAALAAFQIWSIPGELPKVPLRALTAREQAVLGHAATGAQDKVVADLLGVSVPTVRKHMDAVIEKLGAPNKTAAITRASALGLLSMDQGDPDWPPRSAKAAGRAD